MSELPPPVTRDDLAEWYRINEELSRLKSTEIMLRTRIFRHYFTNPVEGTNTSDPIDATGAVVKGGYVLNRSIDVGSLDALREQQEAEGYNGPALNMDQLVKWKPELVLSEYRKLTDEERKFFDTALVIKPGTPSLEITIPKRAK